MAEFTNNVPLASDQRSMTMCANGDCYWDQCECDEHDHNPDKRNLCPGCESEIDRESGEYRASESDGKDYCYGCFESDMEHASTVTYLRNGEDVKTVKVGKRWIVDGEYYEDLPRGDAERYNHWWVSSDAWRGHWNTTIDGWTEVKDGLFLWGEPTSIVELGGKLQDMHKGEELPCEVALVADLTSNVFAAGCSIFVRNADVAAWEEAFGKKEDR